jgi:hypothetical protein
LIMETAISTLSILPTGKEQVQLFVHKLKAEILASDKEPLKILVQLKYIEKTIADILKDDDIDYHFLSEFLLYDKNEKVVINGAELRSSEVGVKYLYESSGDPVWNDLEEKIRQLTDQKKEREKFLQTIPEGGMVDPGSGVFITKAPKTSKSKVIVKMV